MMMLGRLPSDPDRRTLWFRDYLPDTLPSLPDSVRWDSPVPRWSLGGNDRYGNCTIVTGANGLLCWTANASGISVPIADDSIVALSRDMGALNGYSILSRLKWWRRKGMFDVKIWAYARFLPSDAELFRLSIAHTGWADVGLAMPLAWKSQSIWTTGNGRSFRPGSWGLHSVPIVGYDDRHFYAVTWGRLQPITHEALCTFCDEAWSIICPAWLANDGLAPNSLDLAALRADLEALGPKD